MLGFYCLASLAIRTAMSGGLELDESEQLVLTQTLRLGYGPQPPLYIWLQSGFFALFGISIFSLALFKSTLQFLNYVFIYSIAREIIDDARGANIAVLSLFLSPQYGWEFHRTLTNTILATTIGAALLFLVFRLRKKPTISGYSMLGILASLGTLSKYNFALFLAALLLAGLSLDLWRPVILNRRIIASLLTGSLFSAGHLIWLSDNFDKVSTISKKLEISGSHILLTYSQGIINLMIAVLGLFWPLLIVLLLLFKPWGKAPAEPSHGSENRALLGRTVLITLTICLIIVFVTHLTRFNDRWLAPLLFFLPVYLVSRLSRYITDRRYNAFVFISTLMIILITVLFPARVFMASWTGRALRFNYPYNVLSADLIKSGFNGGNIYAEDHRIGGNLRLHFPESSVNVPGWPEVPEREDRLKLVVWDAQKTGTIPPGLQEYVVKRTGITLEGLNPSYVTAPMLYDEDRKMTVGYYLIK